MLIGFIGAPASGKTTIATKMFATLKEQGNNSELIVEEARHYIARKRFKDYKAGNNDPFTLTDEDQLRIAFKQKEIEEVMKFSCGKDSIVVSDSSVFNAALYMSNGFLDQPNRPFFQELKDHYDMVFFCHPINLKVLPEDPNRVHTLAEVDKIAIKSYKLLTMLKSLGIHTHELLGTLSLDQRYKDTCSATMDYYLEMAKRV